MSELSKVELTTLAARINDHHRQAVSQAKSALESARQAGELLTAAKARLPHGGWLPWLSDHCEVSSRQAQRYMRVAANWEAISKNDATSYLTIDEASASVSTLIALVDEATKVERPLAVENMQTKAAIGEILNSLSADRRLLFESILESHEMELQFDYLIAASKSRISELEAT